MDNGQFHIPGNEQLIQEVESAFDPRDAQEMEAQISAYEVVKKNEQDINEWRATATEATIPKSTMVNLALSAVRMIVGR